MPVPADLKHFRASEFRRPELMHESFVRWLDAVRDRAGVVMVVTDDGRRGERPAGSVVASLHEQGRAVDLRSRNWTPQEKWAIVSAIVQLADQAPGKVELETVFDRDGDKHWHLGVDARPGARHELIEADD